MIRSTRRSFFDAEYIMRGESGDVSHCPVTSMNLPHHLVTSRCNQNPGSSFRFSFFIVVHDFGLQGLSSFQDAPRGIRDGANPCRTIYIPLPADWMLDKREHDEKSLSGRVVEIVHEDVAAATPVVDIVRMEGYAVPRFTVAMNPCPQTNICSSIYIWFSPPSKEQM